MLKAWRNTEDQRLGSSPSTVPIAQDLFSKYQPWDESHGSGNMLPFGAIRGRDGFLLGYFLVRDIYYLLIFKESLVFF